MKNILIFLFLLFSLNNFSQDISLELGFGSANSKVKSVGAAGLSDSFEGGTVGVMINFQLSESFKLETGLGFELFKDKIPEELSNCSSCGNTTNVNTFWIPLTAKYYPNSTGRYAKSGFHLRGGISYNYNISQLGPVMRNYIYSFTGGGNSDYGDIVKKGAFSSIFGLGYDISDRFTIVAEYSMQLSNSIKNSAVIVNEWGELFPSLKLRTNVLGISLQYFF